MLYNIDGYRIGQMLTFLSKLEVIKGKKLLKYGVDINSVSIKFNDDSAKLVRDLDAFINKFGEHAVQ